MNARNFLIALCIVAAASVAAGPFASAFSIGEAQAQIQELMAKIKLVQSTQTQSSTIAAESAIISPRICSSGFMRSLFIGARGDEVKSLQEFLISEGILNANATGYFGTATRAALGEWQSRNNIVVSANPGLGWGTFGPRTRAALKDWCSSPKMQFQASPQQGSAPLTVVFSTWLSDFRPSSQTYTIDYGDGTSERAAGCFAPADGCQSPGQNTHTYATDGTYVAKLIYTNDICGGTPGCMAPIEMRTVASVRIQVGIIATACTKEYKPVCALKQVQCIRAPCNPIQQTYGNLCEMQADNATYLHDGACTDTSVNPADDPQCTSWYDGCNTCGRNTPGGSPAVCTNRACRDVDMGRPYCTSYFNSSSNRPPVVSGISGPVSLAVNEQGTWTVSASDPENEQLSYSITWGDEWAVMNSSARFPASESIVQKTTFTHSYAQPGSYTVSVTVRDGAGNEARASATVQVSQTACTGEYAPVCGRPAGCANSCPPGMYCTLMCRMYDPVTYPNRCALNNANAQFLHGGTCTGAETPMGV